MATRTGTATQGEKPRTPKMATQAVGIAHPFLDVSPPFLLVFHPERWMVLAGKLVPSLQRVPLADGVNNVTVERGGHMRVAPLRAKIEEEGRQIVPYTWAPDGVSYLQCLDTRPGGSRNVVETWCTVFETVDAGATETSADEGAYAAWLSDLVAKGRLPRCSINVARRLLDRTVERLEKARGDAAKMDGHGAPLIRAQALEAEREVLAAYVEAVKGERVSAKAKRQPSMDDAGGEA
jgi:hypothetical protein